MFFPPKLPAFVVGELWPPDWCPFPSFLPPRSEDIGQPLSPAQWPIWPQALQELVFLRSSMLRLPENVRPNTEACNFFDVTVKTWAVSARSSGLKAASSSSSSPFSSASSSAMGSNSVPSCSTSAASSNSASADSSPSTCSVWKALRGPPSPFEEAWLEKLEEDLREDAYRANWGPRWTRCWRTLVAVALSTVIPVIAREKQRRARLEVGKLEAQALVDLIVVQAVASTNENQTLKVRRQKQRSSTRFPRDSASYIADDWMPTSSRSRSMRLYLFIFCRTVSWPVHFTVSKSLSSLRFWN